MTEGVQPKFAIMPCSLACDGSIDWTLIDKLKAADLDPLADAKDGAVGAVYKCAKAAVDLYKFAQECSEKKEDEKHFWNGWGHLWTTETAKALIEMGNQASEVAKSLNEIAESLPKMSAAISAYRGDLPSTVAEKNAMTDEIKEKCEHVSSVLDYVDGALKIASSVAAIQDATTAVAAFNSNPSAVTCEAWAKSVGNVFSTMGSVVGLLAKIPGCEMLDTYAQYLAVPATVIATFITCQHTYYDTLDAEIKAANPSNDGSTMGASTSRKM